MKKFILAVACMFCIGVALAKGGGGGGGGGHGSSGGGRSSSPSSSSASRPSAPSSAPRTTTTTTTTTSRSYNSSYVGGGMMYGGMGMGYGYANGMLTGLIIGNMMHPANTVVYNGGGSYNNNALLYPDGRVVNQSGQLVGTYIDGQFTAIPNGAIVAQSVPKDAQAPQPVVIQQQGLSAGEVVLIVVVTVLCVLLTISIFIF